MIDRLSLDIQQLIAECLSLRAYHFYRLSWKVNLSEIPTLDSLAYLQSLEEMDETIRYKDHIKSMKLKLQTVTDSVVSKLLAAKQFSQISMLRTHNLTIETQLLLLDNFNFFKQDFILCLTSNVEKKLNLQLYLTGFGLSNIPVLKYAIRDNEHEIVNLILTRYPIQTETILEAIKESIKFKKWDIAALLLNYTPLPPKNLDDLILLVVEMGHGHEFLEDLLLNPDADPSVKDNYAIRVAARIGNYKIVQILLKNPKVDPAARNNEALLAAVSAGHLPIIELLLADTRIDPSAQNNSALNIAVLHKRQDIAQVVQKALAIRLLNNK
ncbi:hypothetical protein HDV06_006403 [Boothiomyces sp. JEL0866]|nr:hypothetical protein HDV06_006403 [Boothiomyces sp. JEL0866]